MYTYEETIDRLCDIHGIAGEYHLLSGGRRVLSLEERALLLESMGVPASNTAAAEAGLRAHEFQEKTRLFEPVAVVHPGESAHLRLRAPMEWLRRVRARRASPAFQVLLEEGPGFRVETREYRERGHYEVDGREYVALEVDLPDFPPPGYHTVKLDRHADDADILPDDALGSALRLIVVPETCHDPDHAPRSGIAVQLYAPRSGGNHGIGDLEDVRLLAEGLRDTPATVAGVSPLHALFSAAPEHRSPYSPSSRLFYNPLHLRPEALPEWEGAKAAREYFASSEYQAFLRRARAADRIDYREVRDHKFALLRKLYEDVRGRLGAGPMGEEFRAFLEKGGIDLRRQAIYDAISERMRAERADAFGFYDWPLELRDPAGAAAARFARENADLIQFYEYLQFCFTRQLERVNEHCCERGISLYLDLAVGAHPGGAEVWSRPELYARGAFIGAPPDEFSPTGQNWGLAPLIPARMREDGYDFFSRMIRANMPREGIIRIDHALGLFRQFWTTHNGGGYVSYPAREILGVLALESRRNHCMVIGEDLGTVSAEIKNSLMEHRIFSWRVLYFERHQRDEDSADADAPRKDDFLPASAYPERAVATVNTHDLPTVRGFWSGEDIKVREGLGIFSAEAARAAREERARDRERVLALLERAGLALTESSEPESDEFIHALIQALHRFLAQSPARLALASLHDLAGELEQPNLPATVDEYPNWALRHKRDLEEFFADNNFRAALRALRRA